MGCKVSIATCKEICDFTIEPAPKVLLHVLEAPIESSPGARSLGLRGGHQITVMTLDKVKGLEPLDWRFDRGRKAGAGRQSGVAKRDSESYGGASGSDAAGLWPEGYRCDVPKKFWYVTLLCVDDKGNVRHCKSILQVAAPHAARKLDKARLDTADSNKVASYATRFNKYISSRHSSVEEDEGSLVSVAAPIACQVVGSVVPQFIAAGNVVTLYPYCHEEVQKFIFNGAEAFEEVPQAFFHYVNYVSSGREMVCDVQGAVEADGRVLLIDPCIVSMPALSVTDVICALGENAVTSSLIPAGALAAKDTSGPGPSQARFTMLHPMCCALCQDFDPFRKGGITKCGINVGKACF